MRYRIVLEIETDQGRDFLNKLAQHCFDETITKESNPVFLSTQLCATDEQRLYNRKENV